MKRILLASVAALGLAGTASAADLAVKAPVVYAPVFTWTGCYLGVNGGWIGSDESYTSYLQPGGVVGSASGGAIPAGTAVGPAAYQASYNTYGPQESAGTAGGQFGCQAQLGSWVFGAEWDWNWSGLQEDNTYALLNSPIFAPQDWYQYTHKEMDWFSTARLRLGLAWDRVLIYATGGLAYAAFDAYTHVDFVPGTPGVNPEYAGAYREKRFGYAVGGGLEWAFANNWTAKAEFLYLDFGSFDYLSPRYNFGTGAPFAETRTWYTSVDAKEYVARVGINYLFHTGGAPVVARY